MSPDEAGKSSRQPGRPQKQLSPQDGPVAALAQALRDLREASGRPKYRSLAIYAGVQHQRLAEAARGERLPKWQVVEGYVNGCWAYYQHRHHDDRPADGAADLARWRQLYRDAGGCLPEQTKCGETAELPTGPAPDAAGPGRWRAALHRPRLPGSHRGRRLALAGAAGTGVALLTTAAVMSGMTLSPGKPSPDTAGTPRAGTRTARPAGIFVTPPAAACGSVAADGFRSPATTVFSTVTAVSRLSLDGLSVSTMEGTRDGTGYYWIEAHSTSRRAGMQLRWSSVRDQWHYCTATLDAGNISALPGLVTTVAVPATVHEKQVLYQSCVWHQHPYSARCTPVRLSLCSNNWSARIRRASPDQCARSPLCQTGLTHRTYECY